MINCTNDNGCNWCSGERLIVPKFPTCSWVVNKIKTLMAGVLLLPSSYWRRHCHSLGSTKPSKNLPLNSFIVLLLFYGTLVKKIFSSSFYHSLLLLWRNWWNERYRSVLSWLVWNQKSLRLRTPKSLVLFDRLSRITLNRWNEVVLSWNVPHLIIRKNIILILLSWGWISSVCSDWMEDFFFPSNK